MSTVYVINGVDYELYQAASGDWCVSVDDREAEKCYYNLGTKERALEFILAASEVDDTPQAYVNDWGGISYE